MERIDRTGGHARWVEPTPETVLVFDIYGAAHQVVRSEPDERDAPRRAAPEPPSASVIRRWLA